MKYKVGDKVKIKTWEQMKREHKLDVQGNIICDFYFTKEMEALLKGYYPDRILTIEKIQNTTMHSYDYLMKELPFGWSDGMIEDLIPKSIYKDFNRFDIMDLE